MNQSLYYSNLNDETHSSNENKQNEQNLKNQMIINSFSVLYPQLSFDDLKKQNNFYSTDDGCIHYKHKKTRKIFS